MPLFDEQLRIAANTEQLMTLVGELETRETTARHTATPLLSDLVSELTSTQPIFAGKLSLAAEEPEPYGDDNGGRLHRVSRSN